MEGEKRGGGEGRKRGGTSEGGKEEEEKEGNHERHLRKERMSGWWVGFIPVTLSLKPVSHGFIDRDHFSPNIPALNS